MGIVKRHLVYSFRVLHDFAVLVCDIGHSARAFLNANRDGSGSRFHIVPDRKPNRRNPFRQNRKTNHHGDRLVDPGGRTRRFCIFLDAAFILCNCDSHRNWRRFIHSSRQSGYSRLRLGRKQINSFLVPRNRSQHRNNGGATAWDSVDRQFPNGDVPSGNNHLYCPDSLTPAAAHSRM